MKRIAFAAAAALLGTGCISSTTTTYPPPDTGSADISWSFLRYRNTDQSWLTYSCAQAGIDNVLVSFSLGDAFQVPCADSLGDGAMVSGVLVGTQNVTVTGRRGTAVLYTSDPISLTIAKGQVTQTSALAYGIADNLAVYANFVSQFGTSGWSTCAAAGVTSLSYWIEDYANSLIAQGTISCTDPAGVSFMGQDALDRDNYVIRFKGYSGASQTFDSATKAVVPVCDGQAFDHLGPDAWDVFLYDVTRNVSGGYGYCP